VGFQAAPNMSGMSIFLATQGQLGKPQPALKAQHFLL
jgi:hypothetical protein